MELTPMTMIILGLMNSRILIILKLPMKSIMERKVMTMGKKQQQHKVLHLKKLMVFLAKMMQLQLSLLIRKLSLTFLAQNMK
jgi:hypothetical protein